MLVVGFGLKVKGWRGGEVDGLGLRLDGDWVDLLKMVLPRIELGSLDSKSNVLPLHHRTLR